MHWLRLWGQNWSDLAGPRQDLHYPHDGKTIYQGLPNPFPATRYHSLIIETEGLPSCLEVTAKTPEGTIMGVRHRDYVVEGVQFHPESILTEVGHDILTNFLRFTRPVWG